MIVGRDKEIKILRNCVQSAESELIAVIGRRRVGKTFLVRQVFKDQINFELVGIHNGTKEEQLSNFTYELSRSFDITPKEVPKSWIEAFKYLIEVLERRVESESKQIIFIDELPWLASPKSGFMKGFEYFWNSWASKQSTIILVVSGSAASWMHRNLIKNTGGLYNRITRLIHLKPFTLSEVKRYLESRSVQLNQYQIALLYMALGGIPYYLKMVDSGKSATQIIQDLIFNHHAPLKDEFSNLYAALFDSEDRHIEIITLLAQKNLGFTNKEIAEKTTQSSGGTLTKTLKELELSGFITSYAPLNTKKKGTRYKLTDEYSLFYLKFIDQIETSKNVDLNKLGQTQSWKSWSGYAFENLVWKHVESLTEALGITGIHYQTSALVVKSKSGSGFQIDLIIDRADGTVNLCELKFYDHEFSLSSEEANKIRNRIQGLKEYLKKPKHVFVTMVSPYGVKSGKNTIGLIDHSFDLDVFFR